MSAKRPPLERTITHAIKKFMKEIGATCHKTTGGPFAERGVSDLYGTLPGGRAYYLEVKAPGRKGTLTPVQQTFIQNEALHGAVSNVVTSVEDVKQTLQEQGYDWTHSLDV